MIANPLPGHHFRADLDNDTFIAGTLRSHHGNPQLDQTMIAATMKACKDSGGWSNSVDHAAAGYMVPVPHAAISPAIKARDYKGASSDGDGDGAILVPMVQPFSIMPMNSGKDYKARATDIAQPIMAGGPVGGNQGGDFIVNHSLRGRPAGATGNAGDAAAISQRSSKETVGRGAFQVRRLTPVECARLQGFPDDYLDITYRGKPAADGPKYKALGNSWAVPCARWIGERIDAVEQIAHERKAP